MPGIVNGSERGQKRKRVNGGAKLPRSEKRIGEGGLAQEADSQAEILRLEEKVFESRKYYNNISILIKHTKSLGAESHKDVVAAVALCRVFCRLLAGGSLVKNQDASDNEATIVQWLKERYQDYKTALLQMLEKGDATRQSTSLTLLMRLVKGEKTHSSSSDDSIWRTGGFANIVRILVKDSVAEETRQEFGEKFVEEYDDVRYYTLERLADLAYSDPSEAVLQNTLFILTAVETIPEQQEELKDFFVGPPSKAKHDLYSLTAHQKQAQNAWMAVLRNDLSKAQRKTVLDLMSHRIAPWFLKVELLMDFLTDSFNIEGSTSLMALSGLFYLIQHKNLDYPLFYQKLYSLLDFNILHSKYRSRFFRLLDTFLASTHLPAALVASFIKRLSRLTLHAPPSGIVVVVPWIYNLLKNHPSCTFMIHRDGDVCQEEKGCEDPFHMDEPDPMKTDAIESSLWEIQMLQAHYHPNIATIAKIISEQFTKQAYNVEDFLDHSYGTMLDAELSKGIKKPPDIGYEIPKRILLKQEAESGKEDSLLVKLWEFN